MIAAEETLSKTLTRARFWQSRQSIPFNERQRKVLAVLLDGFQGSLTNAKWAKIAGTSSDTALRDLNDLIDKGVLRREGDVGRGARYALIEDQPQL